MTDHIDTAAERERCRWPTAYPPWARNTVLRLLDALDAERARVEKAEAVIGLVRNEVSDLRAYKDMVRGKAREILGIGEGET